MQRVGCSGSRFQPRGASPASAIVCWAFVVDLGRRSRPGRAPEETPELPTVPSAACHWLSRGPSGAVLRAGSGWLLVKRLCDTLRGKGGAWSEGLGDLRGRRLRGWVTLMPSKGTQKTWSGGHGGGVIPALPTSSRCCLTPFLLPCPTCPLSSQLRSRQSAGCPQTCPVPLSCSM